MGKLRHEALCWLLMVGRHGGRILPAVPWCPRCSVGPGTSRTPCLTLPVPPPAPALAARPAWPPARASEVSHKDTTAAGTHGYGWQG